MSELKGTLVGEFYRNHGGQIDFGVETSFLVLVYITLALRVWSRSIQGARYQVNDWLIFVATLFMSARYAIEVTVILKCGLGLHISEVIAIGGPQLLGLFPKLVYALDLLFASIVSIVKLSILHLYTVVFRGPRFIRFVHVIMGITVAFWIASLFATAFICIPPQKLWLPDTPGHCGDTNRLHFGIATVDFLLDIAVFVAPFPILWKLQLSNWKKVGLSIVFGLGFAIVVVTAVRFKTFFIVDENDVTFTIWPQGVYAAVVPLLGIVNANLPVIQPAMRKCFVSLRVITTTVIKGSNASSSAESRSRPFERLPKDSIHLTSITPGPGHDHRMNEDGQIRVTRDWGVSSTEAIHQRDATDIATAL